MGRKRSSDMALTNGLSQINSQTNKYTTRESRNSKKKELNAFNSIFNQDEMMLSKGGNGGLTNHNTTGLPNQDTRNNDFTAGPTGSYQKAN